MFDGFDGEKVIIIEQSGVIDSFYYYDDVLQRLFIMENYMGFLRIDMQIIVRRMKVFEFDLFLFDYLDV